uniref:Uncharacterized protein n=1 Tax=Cacopsylla melanoneura TaxID=428564 RepID=A0A8D8WN82_9HEMI
MILYRVTLVLLWEFLNWSLCFQRRAATGDVARVIAVPTTQLLEACPVSPGSIRWSSSRPSIMNYWAVITIVATLGAWKTGPGVIRRIITDPCVVYLSVWITCGSILLYQLVLHSSYSSCLSSTGVARAARRRISRETPDLEV